MIHQHQIKEISKFLDIFLRAFDLFITAHVNKSGDNDFLLSEPFIAAYRVSGEISGYLSAVYNKGDITTSMPKYQFCGDQLIPLYYSAASQSDRSNGIKLEAAASAFLDQIMYSVRKSEPQMTIRIQVNNYSLDFFAFPVKNEWQQAMNIC